MSKLHTEKIIKIKPIEFLRKRDDHTASLSEDSIQEELKQAHDELQNLLKEKELLVKETTAEIEAAKENWKTEKQNYIKEAEHIGYEAGYKNGKEESLEKYRHLLDKADSITKSALSDYHTTIDKNEETIIELAIHTAEKIMNQKIAEDPDAFLSIVKTAIGELKDQSVITIYLHPVNYQFVLQQKEELNQILENEAKLSIQVNEEVAENGCLIQHPFGQLDASIDTQLQQIRDALHELAMENKQ
ncbi:flagellar assembly protein FliH [Virgibacillus sp. C22-A2]|uniref:Flagellar assembly protein FliH n=1 Tax=Virgibacillus tibetensis TaxID=3042313 RepID=A0ABU6KCY6_9BACI|nr:flagellar assembly protein FliH [Virgibacillus sp. C22-A2]